ncbi:MAG: hypothetical protein ACRC6K_04280 [Fusobacteriaceae bacterium]
MISIMSYSFQIDKVNFDEVIERGILKSKSKEYSLYNNTQDIKQYEVFIEGEYSNIKISPSKFTLKPEATKLIKIRIRGEGKKGENSYYLVFYERNLSKQRENKIIINKKIRIKQKYIIKEKEE